MRYTEFTEGTWDSAGSINDPVARSTAPIRGPKTLADIPRDSNTKTTMVPGVTNTGVTNGNNTDTDTDQSSDTVQGSGSGRITYATQGKIRNQALHPKLKDMLERTAQAVGVDVVVSSGGQMSIEAYRRAPGEKSNSGGTSPTYYLNRRAVRKGSTRHDNGMAADIQIRSGGQNIKLDTPLMNKFVEEFFKNPDAGGGSGDTDYMGDYTIHVDIHKTRSRSWNATPQFLAAMNRGLSNRGTA